MLWSMVREMSPEEIMETSGIHVDRDGVVFIHSHDGKDRFDVPIR